MMLMMMVRMMIWNEKVSATVVWRWKCRDMLNNRHWSFTLENMSLPADTAATADICGQLVLTADSGLQSAMTVPGQRSTTERATAAHHLDDARQISIHSASLARNRSRQPRLQSTRPRNTAATTHKVRHLTKGAQRLRMFWPGPGRACCCCDPCKGGSEGQGSFEARNRSSSFRWCTADFDPLSVLGAQPQPAATLAVDASKEHGRDHAQSPPLDQRSSEVKDVLTRTWPSMLLLRSLQGRLRRSRIFLTKKKILDLLSLPCRDCNSTMLCQVRMRICQQVHASSKFRIATDSSASTNLSCSFV